MAQITLDDEVLKEIAAITERIGTASEAELEESFEQIRTKADIPPTLVAKGMDCGGCVSCGACPIAHIKAGYLLTALMLSK
jgi:sorbitol-specific phosphotransferase system component IIBC